MYKIDECSAVSPTHCGELRYFKHRANGWLFNICAFCSSRHSTSGGAMYYFNPTNYTEITREDAMAILVMQEL